MSVTTTSNPLTYASATVLADYQLTHSSESSVDEDAFDQSLNNHPAPAPHTHAPADWPTQHRRVPAFRPVNTRLDQSERRVYQNGVERAFIGTMFTGVWVLSTASKVWHATAGRVWDVGYKLGGEW
ncbi:uncharacterized protein M421DRAFT_50172 [Didymella exigua CBS 183.55]|uniref:Uncharacterized protein n=1 Tax=Didymella exigua CBS 183.55 TaxID=1150837 RepID=A0A6A5RZG5_9PLEO|nr:uncharacterized protein M421DRAFT_50172 [Didymella exigua CBS 183.55]KAF1933855.1 hypothetical protein M421DRAFT_50172 [Didymella exigua CBS 183.55]